MLVGVNGVVLVLFFVDSVIEQGLLGLDVPPLLRRVVPCPIARQSCTLQLANQNSPWPCATPMQKPRRQSQSKQIGQECGAILVEQPGDGRNDSEDDRAGHPMVAFLQCIRLIECIRVLQVVGRGSGRVSRV